MSTIINADTSDGLKFTSDTSGEIKLQSAGADIATVNSSGMTMASGKGLAATGHVLQVVSATFNTSTVSTANSYVATHITANITPSSTSSKILVIVNSCYGLGTTATNFRYARIYRNTTGVGNVLATRAGFFSSTSDLTHFTMQYLDSPATTSSTTYTLYMNNDNGDGFSIGGRYINTGANQQSTITLMEVAG